MVGLVAAALVVGAAASLTSQSAPVPTDAGIRPHCTASAATTIGRRRPVSRFRTSISPTCPRRQRSGRRSRGRCARARCRRRRCGIGPMRQPPTAFASFLEETIDRAAASHPNPGRATVHRLNRAEYSNAIRDLLARRRPAGRMAAGRRFRLRLRQHRGGAVDLARAARPLHVGGAQSEPARGRRPGAEAGRGNLRRETRSVEGQPQRTVERRSAVRLARRHDGASTTFRSTPSTCSRFALLGVQPGRRTGRGRSLSGARAGEGGPPHRRRHVAAREPEGRTRRARRQPGAGGRGGATADPLARRPAARRRPREAIRRVAATAAGDQQAVVGGPYTPTGRGDTLEPAGDLRVPRRRDRRRSRPARAPSSPRSRVARSAGR